MPVRLLISVNQNFKQKHLFQARLKFILENQLLRLLQEGRAYYHLNFPAFLCLWPIIAKMFVKKTYQLKQSEQNMLQLP